jgi:hypothetical protein
MVTYLNKQAAARRLEELGERPRPDWTVLELRSRILELQAEQSAESAEDFTICNIGIKNKPELIEMCKRLNVECDEKDTKGVLMRKARDAYLLKTPPCSSDLVLFGTHTGKTFSEVRRDYLTYCQWVVNSAQDPAEPTTSMKSRFAAWLEQDGELYPTVLPEKTPKEEPTERPPPSSYGATLKELSAERSQGSQHGAKKEHEEVEADEPHTKVPISLLVHLMDRVAKLEQALEGSASREAPSPGGRQ